MLKAFNGLLNKLVFFFLLTAFSVFAVSCGSDEGGGGNTSNTPPVTNYDVSFYDNGVILTQFNRTVASGTQITLPSYTKLGYTLDGWLLNGTGNPLTTYTVNANTTFVAKWSATNPGVTEYTVSFYSDGSLIPELGLAVESGTQITLPSYTKLGYTLDGWLLNGTGNPLTSYTSYTVNANTTFVAKWSTTNSGVTEYTVSFYSDGSLIPELGLAVESGTQITLPSYTKLGYTLDGWLLNGTGNPLTSYTVNANTTFVAKWSATNPGVTEYTVSFYSDGSLIPELGLTVESGTQITLPSYTKLGYTLDGWLLNGTGNPLTSYTSYTVNANTTFVAKWTAINPVTEYTVSFYDDGNPIPELGLTVESGTQITLPPYTKLGYTLDGWLLNGNGSPLTTTTYTVNANTTFVAKWTADAPGITYTVSFYDNGDLMLEFSGQKASGARISLPIPEKIGYTFNRWFLNGINEPLADNYTVTEDAVFIAGWTPNRASITEYTVFFYDNGFVIPEISVAVESGTEIALPALTKTGYTFDGWLESFDHLFVDETISPIDGAYTVTGNRYFRAQFTATDFTRHTVSYYDEAGYKYPDIGGIVNSGDVVTMPTRMRKGYTFNGWVKNDALLPVKATYTVTDNTSFYADFTLPDAVYITTAEELYNIRDNLSGKYILADNISLVEYNYDYDSGWEPIGTYMQPFTGILDGNGFKITDLGVDRDVSGLFGYIRNGAVISNLTVEVTSVKGLSYAGGLAGNINGTADNRTIISNVHIRGTGAIQTNSLGHYVGGISGHLNNAILSGCSNTSNISSSGSSSGWSGGIAGRVGDMVTITNCYNTGDISSPSTNADSGGIVGAVSTGTVTITDCYNTGDITLSAYSGGIVGYVGSGTVTITDCYNTGDITLSAYSGGIVGYVGSGTVTITNCYNTGDISSPSTSTDSGGIVGYVSYGTVTIMNCYNRGAVSSSRSGGIVGNVSNGTTVTIMNCYNRGDITSRAYSGGIVGYVGGIVTITNCYNNGGITSSDYSGGIVGEVHNGTVTITNCYNIGYITSSTSSTSSPYSGGIVGHLDGNVTITDCYNTGAVFSSTSGSAGGIVGRVSLSFNTLTIANCYNIGDISSYRTSGGIVGELVLSSSTATIRNNAAINAVIKVDASSSNKHLGRIVGLCSEINVTISNNFALSSMQAVGGSFNTNPNNHGISKTESALKTRSTYESTAIGNGLGGLGWQFGNDDEHPWKMPVGGGYPVLYWQE